MQKVRELVTALSLQVRLVPSWNWTCSISHLIYSYIKYIYLTESPYALVCVRGL